MDSSMSRSLKLERKTVINNPTPEMINVIVKNAIKCIKSPDGASVEDVCKYVESKYNMEVLKSSVIESLNVGVNIGTFQKVNEKYFLEGISSRKKVITNMDTDSPYPEMNHASMSASLNPESNAVIEIATPGMVSTMVIHAVKSLKKPNGSSLEDVCKCIEDNYDIKVSKDDIYKILKEGVSVGILEKISGEYFHEKETSKRKVFAEERFKMAEEKTEDREQKAEIQIPTRAMIIMMLKYSIKNLKQANGAYLVDILSYIEENYRVNMKFFEFSVGHILSDMVHQGVLETTNGADGRERFKIKE